MTQFLQRNARLCFAIFLVCGVWLLPAVLSSHQAIATPVSSSVAACPANSGAGGSPTTNNADTRGGDGCVVIKEGSTFHTFTYTGAEENWTVPNGVSSIEVYLIGAGGGGGNNANNVWGGGGGYVTGTLSVTGGETLRIIVGQGGTRMSFSDVDAVPVSNTTGRHNYSFGGGGMGNGEPPYNNTFASGGGRSAIRQASATEDLVTAGGGGGGGYSGSGGAGGGLTGANGGGPVADSGKGGTQSAGGATGATEPGVAGIKYAGGWAGYSTTRTRQSSEAGGGGGGYYGGGAGGDNCGGGGGSSFIDNLTNGSSTAGSGKAAGAKAPVNTAQPTVSGILEVGQTVTAVAGTWANGGDSTFQWQSSTDGVTFTDIAGANAQTYTITSSGFLRVVEIRHSLFTDVTAQSTSANIPVPSTTSTSSTSTSTTTSTSTSSTIATTVQSVGNAGSSTLQNQVNGTTTTVALINTSAEQKTEAEVVTTSTVETSATSTTQVGNNSATEFFDTSSVNPFDVQDAAPKYLKLTLDLAAGEPAQGKKLVSTAGGLQPGSDVILEMHSTPVLLGESVADATGSVTFTSDMPDKIEPGMHRLILTGTTKDGSQVSATAAFEIDSSGIVSAVVPAAESLSGVPSASEMARSLDAGVPIYDTTANTATTAGLAVAATVMMAALASGAANKKSSDSKSERDHSEGQSGRDGHSHGEIGSLETSALKDLDAHRESWGDKSWTWAFPGAQSIHRIFDRMYVAVSTKSSVLGRLVADGHWVRAAFGSLQLIPLLCGLCVGIVAGIQSHGIFVPAFGFTLAIIVLAMLDALAGCLAWIGFTVIVVSRYGLSGLFDFRTLLGLGVLYMGIPLLANHTRPLRRRITESLDRVDRFSDYVLAPLLVGFAAHGLYMALNGLSGLQMVVQTNADQLKWVVGLCVVARMALEDLVTYAYPKRLDDSELSPTPGTPMTVDVATIGVKTGLYLIGAASFFGLGWRTWVVIGLMNIVPSMKLVQHKFPNYPLIHRWFPRGVLRTVVMLFVGTWFASWVLGANSDPEHIKAMTAILLLPGILIGSLDVIGREGGEWPDSLWMRLLGGVLWTYLLGVLLGLYSA